MKYNFKNSIICPLCKSVHNKSFICQRNGGMINVHPEFYTKPIRQYISDLIHEYGYTHYIDLSTGDKAKLASLLIDAAGKDGYECIIESTNSDQTLEVFKKSLSGTNDDDEIFLETIKSNAINYYDAIMNTLFNEMMAEYISERNEWMDYVAKQTDPDAAYEQYRRNL